MALNQYMHPRNPFRHQRPNFTQLAEKYEFLGELTTKDERGRVILDFHNAASLSALTRALLLEHWSLDVIVPPNRLVPTVPLRLNYLLWLEDLVKANAALLGSAGGVRVLDIGCGASCIYPLLGVKQFPHWTFVATESDSFNLQTARENVQRNALESRIQVVTSPADYAEGLLPSNVQETFDLCMCNPPFFSDPRESVTASRDLHSRHMPPSMGSNVAVHSQEGCTPGGEVAFVSQLIMESLKTPNKVMLCTSMLGKKKSLGPLKSLLHARGVHHLQVHEMCQGRVMRWGLAWTTNSKLTFPPSPFHLAKLKERPPISWTVPRDLKCLANYSHQAVLQKLEEIFAQLKIKVLEQKNKANKGGIHLLITAQENTWSHSRRKRREMMRQQQQEEQKQNVSDGDFGEANVSGGSEKMETSVAVKRQRDSCENVTPTNGKTNEAPESLEAKRRRVEEEHIHSEGAAAWCEDGGDGGQKSEFLVQATVSVETLQRKNEDNEGEEGQANLANGDVMPDLQIQMKLKDGDDREVLNQIMQFIRNAMK